MAKRETEKKGSGFVGGLILGSIITCGISAALIYSCSKENVELVNDCNQLQDDYNKLVNEWNEKIATKKGYDTSSLKKEESPNPHWKNYKPGHLTKNKTTNTLMVETRKPGNKDPNVKTYMNVADGLEWTVIGGAREA